MTKKDTHTDAVKPTENVDTADTAQVKKKKEHDKKHGESKKHDELVQKIDELEAEKKNFQDKLARVMADFDNYRRRNDEDRSRFIKQAGEKLLLELIPVLDDLTRALDACTINEHTKTLVDGLRLVEKKFNDVLTINGVKPIEALHKPFDPQYHEALTMIADGDHEHEEQVIQEYRKGYMLYEKVLRPAQVVVSKKKEIVEENQEKEIKEGDQNG